MIRVLHIVTYMGRGGLETMLMNYYRHINRNQIQFDFLVHREEEFDYDREINELGGKLYHLPRMNPFSIHYKNALGCFFDSHPEYQIIHVHQDCMSSVILKIAKEHGVKVRIAHSHSSSQDKNLKYPIKMFYKRLIPKYATDLMACGKKAGGWIFGNAPFRILNNAIDVRAYVYDGTKREQIRNLFGIDDKTMLVGHIGRFSSPKNHSFLVDVFASVKTKNPSTKLMLVGDDKIGLAQEIKKKIRDLSLEAAVIFTGLRSDVPDLLQAMDVFVFPSKYEGFPVTIVEAQASGLQCFISDRVPIECKVTDLVEQIRLDESIEYWADRVLESHSQRKDTYKTIVEAGFDIKDNAEKLKDYYLMCKERFIDNDAKSKSI